MKLLLANGANVDRRDGDGQTVLERCGFGSTEIVRLLIQHGAEVPNSIPSRAAEVASAATLQLLVNGGATIRHESARLVNAACRHGNIDALSFFVDYGLSLGTAALEAAVSYGTTETVEWLLEHGVDARIQSADVDFTITRAAFQRHGSQLLKRLISSGLKIDSAETESGQPALIAASRLAKDKDEACQLVELGASVKIVDNLGRTALHFACLAGSVELARVLIYHGASLHKIDVNGWNTCPLCLCC